MLATIIPNVPHHPSHHCTGIDPVCTERHSMADIVWEIVHIISAPQIIKNNLKPNENIVSNQEIDWQIRLEIVCTISRTISLNISASSPTQFPRI